MAADQQLVEYIQKAKDAGQTDTQTRDLLYKNGWTVAEVNDAFASVPMAQPVAQPAVQPQAKPEAQIQPQVQPEIQAEPEPEIKPQPQPEPEPEIQPKPQYQPQVQEQPMPRMRKSHVILKILMVLIILVALAGAGLYFGGQYLNLSFMTQIKTSINKIYTIFPVNSSVPAPEIVVNNMLAAMGNVKSFRTVTQGSIGNLSFSVNGGGDTTDANNPKANFTFLFNLTAGAASPLASANADVIVVGNNAYVKINNLAMSGSASLPGLDVSKIEGQWFKIDQDSINALSAAGVAQTGTGIIVSANVPSGFAKSVQDLVSAEKIYSVAKQLPDEVKGGQNTYHYLITISKDKVKDLVNKIMALQAEPSALQMQETFADSIIDSMGDINANVWIGKKDYLLYEVSVDKVIGQTAIKFDMANSNFNQPVIAQEPASSQKIENVVLPLLKMLQIKSDMSQIGIATQGIFTTNKSYSLACKNGYLAGSKTGPGAIFVTAVNDIIKKQGGQNPVCFGSDQNFCSSTQLPDGSFMCVGANNSLGSAKCVSAQTVCQ